MPQLKIDVIVVGGGPGGAAAAITAATRGLSTVLIEREASPNGRPGETLPPGVEPIFRQLGVLEEVQDAGFLRHEGHQARWNGAHESISYGADAIGPWRGFQADRAVLHGLLLARATRCGVRVQAGVRAVRPIVETNRVRGVQTEEGALRADLTIDASGRRHWLARHLGLPCSRQSAPLLVEYGYDERSTLMGRADPELVGDEAGWTWEAPITKDRVAWVRLPLVPNSSPRFGVRRQDVTWRRYPAEGEGYRLVGDAACVLDPLCGHGVLRALMSGIVAASPCEPGGYGRWLYDWFEHDAAALRLLYARLGPVAALRVTPPVPIPSARDQLMPPSISQA